MLIVAVSAFKKQRASWSKKNHERNWTDDQIHYTLQLCFKSDFILIYISVMIWVLFICFLLLKGEYRI